MNLDPSRQLNLFGHETQFTNLTGLYANKKLPNKILLSGVKGIGKSTLAYHIVNYILSYDEDFSYNDRNFKINPGNKSFKLIIKRGNSVCSTKISSGKLLLSANKNLGKSMFFCFYQF